MSIEPTGTPMSPHLPIIDGEPFTAEQKQYLTGFFAGMEARGIHFSDADPAPLAAAAQEDSADLILEERIKRELHPLDAYPRLLEYAAANKSPDKEDLFRFKWQGLFYLTPTKEAFMARLRIPGGILQSYQIRGLARAACELTTGYIQITTRANLQMRLIAPKDTPEFLRRVQATGLHTRGAGADNIRNITAHPTTGIDPNELIDVRPYVEELAQLIINDRSFYDLPRKFNIAFDGGGAISCVEDTNDIGVKAVLADGAVHFRIALGGATGHQAFAQDLGVSVPPAEINRVITSLVRVFIAHGNRGDRKRARLKHLLDKWPIDEFLAATEKEMGHSMKRVPPSPGMVQYPDAGGNHAHVGIHPQKQAGLCYIGAGVPVGHLTAKHLMRLADLADHYGSGEVRLTVWQNFILPNIPIAFAATVEKALRKMGFDTQPSHLRSGIIACTGSKFCKFAQADTKGHALALRRYLDSRIPMDRPINIHFTGCPHSCAQHYMGDIGLLGTKVRRAGETIEGYHIFVGGGFGNHRAIGRQIYTGIAHDEVSIIVERMLRAYLAHRVEVESFQQFTMRHDLNTLQKMFDHVV
jgi:ferredoxin-nitrite reductase